MKFLWGTLATAILITTASAIPDQLIFDVPQVQQRLDLSTLKSPIHKAYHPYDNSNHSNNPSRISISQLLQEFELQFSQFAHIVRLDKSFEGRDILGLEISNTQSEFEDKKTIVIIANQHAREWITTSTALYYIHRLLVSASATFDSQLFRGRKLHRRERKKIKKFLNRYNVLVIPTLNPDGYTFSRTTDRLWRKNRQVFENDTCVGIDLNRNWGYQFISGSQAEVGSCDEEYMGETPFQAPELIGLKSYLLNVTNRVEGFIDLHSFGQNIMYPYAYTCKESNPDEEDQIEAIVGAAKAIRKSHGRTYTTGSVCKVGLGGSGSAVDWVYSSTEKVGVKWSFALELRDQGIWGFLIPEHEISDVGEEVWDGLLELWAFIGNKEA